MDILRDSLPGAQFRIVDGTLYLDFTVSGKRPVSVCLTTKMQENEQTCDVYDEWWAEALQEVMTPDARNPFDANDLEP